MSKCYMFGVRKDFDQQELANWLQQYAPEISGLSANSVPNMIVVTIKDDEVAALFRLTFCDVIEGFVNLYQAS